jgi:hypothetical protein
VHFALQGLFSVVETGTDDEWLKAHHPALRDVYVVRPGKGGYRYLRNVADRLQAVGFQFDVDSNVWIRPKVVAGVPSLIDVRTLQEKRPPPEGVDTRTGLPLDYWD